MLFAGYAPSVELNMKGLPQILRCFLRACSFFGRSMLPASFFLSERLTSSSGSVSMLATGSTAIFSLANILCDSAAIQFLRAAALSMGNHPLEMAKIPPEVKIFLRSKEIGLTLWVVLNTCALPNAGYNRIS